jgi:hypothetical protein
VVEVDFCNRISLALTPSISGLKSILLYVFVRAQSKENFYFSSVVTKLFSLSYFNFSKRLLCNQIIHEEIGAISRVQRYNKVKQVAEY